MSPTALKSGKPSSTSIPHPLDQLSVSEIGAARKVILTKRAASVAIKFRSIFLEEPPKKELSQFLELEHSGKFKHNTRQIRRLAKVQYDVVRGDKDHEYMESVIDILAGTEVDLRTVEKAHQSGLTT